MIKDESVPYIIFKDILDKSHKLQSELYFMETFVEYIKENNLELYEKAYKHTKHLELNGYWTEEEKQKWGMK